MSGDKFNRAAEDLEINYDIEAPSKNDYQPTGVTNGYILQNSPSIGVIGSDLSAYKYKLDGAPVWNELDISSKFPVDGTSGYETIHTVKIIVQDTAGNWQAENEPLEF